MSYTEINSTLLRMSELLQLGGYTEWAASLRNLAAQMERNPSSASTTIIGMFGGAGSLNDLVLFRDGMPLRRENQELDDLRTKLFSLTHR